MSKTHFRTFELPRDSSHDIHGVSSTHSNTDGTQATAIGSVGVCTNQHHSRIGVILQDDLSKERDIHSQSQSFLLGLKISLDCFLKWTTSLEMSCSGSTRQEVILITLAQTLFGRNCMLIHCRQCQKVQNLLKIPCRHLLKHTKILSFE